MALVHSASELAPMPGPRPHRLRGAAAPNAAPARICGAARRRCRLQTTAQASSSPAAALPISSSCTKVRMATLPTCQLAVSWYPIFAYKAQDGGGSGTVADAGGKLKLTFDPDALNIPALNWRTASIWGIPIPPPLNIAINPKKFEGTLDPATGELQLNFLAEFVFTAGPLYCAPPLIVETVLTTEHSEGQIRSADGTRLGPGGSARLVGVARVPKVDEFFTDLFLSLPTDALAVMDATFEFE